MTKRTENSALRQASSNVESTTQARLSPATSDTAIGFETAELDLSPQSTKVEPTKVEPSRRRSSQRPRVRKQAVAANPIAIRTGAEDGEEDDAELWESTYRGMPSWLSSLIFHLSAILILALLTVNNGGREVVNLFAATAERDALEPFEAVDLVLDPEMIESLDQEQVEPVSKLEQTADLTPVLENATLTASLDSESQDNLFERLASSGLDDADLPRRTSGGSAQFFGVEGEGADFVFIIDCSGSMADYGRWRRAVGELKKSVAELTDDQRFLILLYNDGFVAMNDDAKLVASTKKERKKAFKWLASNFPGSWTFCADALEKALTLQPDAIFLLSDGEFNDRQDVFFVLDTMNSKKRLQRYARKQTPVHTIALGSHMGSGTMKRIAEENSGLYKLVE